MAELWSKMGKCNRVIQCLCQFNMRECHTISFVFKKNITLFCMVSQLSSFWNSAGHTVFVVFQSNLSLSRSLCFYLPSFALLDSPHLETFHPQISVAPYCIPPPLFKMLQETELTNLFTHLPRLKGESYGVSSQPHDGRCHLHASIWDGRSLPLIPS